MSVGDTTAPVISSLTASSTSQWPPNHNMVPVTLTPVASDADGVAAEAAGDFDKALAHFANAWDHTTKAIVQAAK